MKQSFYLALRYIFYHKIRSMVLIAAIGLITFLPNGLQRLIEESEKQMMARADSTPLIIGAKGSSTDLVINTMYFQQENMETITIQTVEMLNQSKLGTAIPLLSGFKARVSRLSVQISTTSISGNFMLLRVEI